MKKHISMTAVGCALCIAAVGVFTGCSDNKSSEPVEIMTTDIAVTSKPEETDIATTQAEVNMQSIPITSDNARLQSRTVMQDDILWLVQSGSAAEFTVSGRNASLTIAGSSGLSNFNPRYAVYVDERQIWDSVMEKQEETVTLWNGEDKTATVKVILLSEAIYGGIGIRSLDVESDSAQPVAPTDNKTLSIEFIGDSITCGYGVESKPSDSFSTSTENFTKSYAYLTAKELDADYTTCCYSGYGIVSGYSADGTKDGKRLLPDCYGLTSDYKDYATDWDFSEECDVIVINLGTNDMNYVAADPEAHGNEFVEGYKAFLQNVRKKRPDSYIICTMGTMGGKDIYELIERAVSEYGDEKITTYFSQTHTMRDGMGADGHPSKKTQQYSADVLAEKIRNVLGE